YTRTLNQFGRPDATTRDAPFLYNATLAVHPSDDVTLFGSYTRGLEDSGQAPNNAVNRGEAAPAARSSQIDAGFRYAFTPRLSAVAGVFEIKKPYFNVDQNRFFTQVGQLRHRGVEVSLAGQAAEGLTVVAGTVLLEARISGDLVSRGLIGPRPV